MKEYLEKQADGSYKLVMRGIVGKDDDIEVPEGAETLTVSGDEHVFWKDKGKYSFHTKYSKYWDEANFEIANLSEYISHYGDCIVWQRHTQPEELPFLDSLPEFKHDFVNHPKHYCDHPSGIECIEITRHHDFAIGNAIKYLWRAGLKDSDNEIQDLKKAVWYIQDKIAQLDNK